jgi:excisionase family DNA binding protein
MNLSGLTIDDVARELATNPKTVRSWIATGVTIGGRRLKLGSIRLGKRIRVPREAIEAFVRGCNPPAPAEAESAAEFRRRGQAAKLRGLAACGGES